MNALVSIVIPCYNHARYLTLAIDSILTQTYQDWEAIIVDDGSTDDTAQVVTGLGEPRVYYVYQENQGLSAARNTGIRHARGEYLAFLDADDAWEPMFLEASLATLQTHPDTAGTYTGLLLIDENGAVLPRLPELPECSIDTYSQILEGGFFPPCSALVSRKSVSDAGLFDTELEGAGTEDWDLWLRITRHQCMCGVPQRLARYRVYPGSMSTNAARMHANRMAVLAKHLDSPAGAPSGWPTEKQLAYGYAYLQAALGYLQQQQPQEAWEFMRQAAVTYPPLLARLDTFYELACGNQPRGYRGQADLLDIKTNGTEMLARLGALFAAHPDMETYRHPCLGLAYMALAMLSDQAGRWGEARGYLVRALRAYPALVCDRSVIRRLAKLCAGKGVVSWLRQVRRRTPGESE